MTPKKRDKDIAAMQKGYWKAQGHEAHDVLMGELKGSYFGFGDWVGMMLLGMALYKNGFLPGRLSRKTYVWTAVIGLSLVVGRKRPRRLEGLGRTLRHVPNVALDCRRLMTWRGLRARWEPPRCS